MAHPRSGRAIHSPSPMEERDLSRSRKRRDPNRAGKSPSRDRVDAESAMDPFALFLTIERGILATTRATRRFFAFEETRESGKFRSPYITRIDSIAILIKFCEIFRGREFNLPRELRSLHGRRIKFWEFSAQCISCRSFSERETRNNRAASVFFSFYKRV